MLTKFFAFGTRKQAKLPMKNTFIHFDTSDDEDEQPKLRSEVTCPSIIQQGIFRTNSAQIREKRQKEAELHACGECRPCAYFAFKKDGCRMGEDCEFCHLCDRSQVRRWQRARAKAMHAEGTLMLSEDYARSARRCGGA